MKSIIGLFLSSSEPPATAAAIRITSLAMSLLKVPVSMCFSVLLNIASTSSRFIISSGQSKASTIMEYICRLSRASASLALSATSFLVDILTSPVSMSKTLNPVLEVIT